MRKAILKLRDGKEFTGISFGADAQLQAGEVVFNTGIPGYQEILTDPSYNGQIVTLTSPMIGNYGISRDRNESGGIKATALIVRKLYRGPIMPGRITLDEFLKEEGITGIEDLDTRALTLHLRNNGSQNGIIFYEENRKVAEKKLQEFPLITERDLIDGVSRAPCKAHSPCGLRREALDNILPIRARRIDIAPAAIIDSRGCPEAEP